MKSNARLIILMLFLLLPMVSQAQQMRGSNGKSHWDSPVDSLMFVKQVDLYIGRRGSVYNSWLEEPKKYYPLMEAAWKYCQTTCPDQYQLYLDGIYMNRYMHSKSESHADSALYFQKIMDVYDMRIANLNAINASVKKARLRSSKGAIMMLKVNEWETLSADASKRDTPEYLEQLYNRYLPIIQYLQDEVEKGNANIGGDLRPDFIKRFFFASASHYAAIANAFNNDTARVAAINRIEKEKNAEITANNAWLREFYAAHPLPTTYKTEEELAHINQLKELRKHAMDSIYALRDSIRHLRDSLKDEMRESSQGVLRNAGAVISDHYNFIVKLADTQKSSLGRDFKPEPGLSDADFQLKLDSFITEVGKPYDDMIAYCNLNMQSLNINTDENAVYKLEMKYDDELAAHADSLNWLYHLKVKCEMATDFMEDDPFYVKVSNMFDECNRKYGQKGGSMKSDYYYQAQDELKKLKQGKPSQSEMIAILRRAVRLFESACQDDPGRSQEYQKKIAACNKSISGMESNAKANADYQEYLRKKQAEEDFWKGKK